MLRISRVFDLFSAFREVAPSIPASYAQAFLAVAMKPGQPTGDYAHITGMRQPVVSRTLLEIGKKSRAGGMGLGLVDSVDDNQDLRVKRYFLTPKGHKLIKDILDVMARDEPRDRESPDWRY
jgi:DNA-binding MarR family transcriptional regulator